MDVQASAGIWQLYMAVFWVLSRYRDSVSFKPCSKQMDTVAPGWVLQGLAKAAFRVVLSCIFYLIEQSCCLKCSRLCCNDVDLRAGPAPPHSDCADVGSATVR